MLRLATWLSIGRPDTGFNPRSTVKVLRRSGRSDPRWCNGCFNPRSTVKVLRREVSLLHRTSPAHSQSTQHRQSAATRSPLPAVHPASSRFNPRSTVKVLRQTPGTGHYRSKAGFNPRSTVKVLRRQQRGNFYQESQQFQSTQHRQSAATVNL